MNERIEKLVEQATIKTSHRYITWGNTVATQSEEVFDKEKFAELIVQECCAIADQVERADMDSYVSKYIRAHFGVEE